MWLQIGIGIYGYICTGDVVGYGADGEPLLTNIKPLARVSKEALKDAQAIYDEQRPMKRR